MTMTHLALLCLLAFVVTVSNGASFINPRSSVLHQGFRKRAHFEEEFVTERKHLTECVEPIFDVGHYVYKSPGFEGGHVEACGLYIIAAPEQIVEVEFEAIDVTCKSGLVAFFDGWEMNGKLFPSDSDHQLPIKERITELCGNENIQNLKFRSSQNAALIQYKVPRAGEGFSIRVKFVENPKPCHILMSDLTGIFTLTNYGHEHRNCSLTTLLFPAHFQIEDFRIGHHHGLAKKNKIIVKDDSMCRGQDYLEIGGSADLETTDLETKEEICIWPARKSMTVLCGSSTIRLVSSGNFVNSLTVIARAAGDSDLLESQGNSVLVCPSFS